MFCLATNEIVQTGLSSLPPVIYYSEQLFRGWLLIGYVPITCCIGRPSASCKHALIFTPFP
ncbi:hypothetical protein C2U29_17240 [Aeromonas veronii]|nr:hypothetical protein C2U29_17240 [Aeromonas veronii]